MLILITLLFNIQANAYENGNAPFCIMDNYGNTQCYYYDMISCREALSLQMPGATCTHR